MSVNRRAMVSLGRADADPNFRDAIRDVRVRFLIATGGPAGNAVCSAATGVG